MRIQPHRVADCIRSLTSTPDTPVRFAHSLRYAPNVQSADCVDALPEANSVLLQATSSR